MGLRKVKILTILTCFYMQMLGLDDKMREEREMGKVVEKEKMG